MAKLFLLGGESVVKRDARQINVRAFEEAGETPAVLVFPWARPSFERSFLRRRRLFVYLRCLGADDVTFAEYSDSPEDLAGKLARSDLVYLTGGQASILLTRLESKKVDALLREYKGIIVGRSAGALALARRCVVKDRYTGATRMVEGLGLADVCLKAHYQPSSDNMLKKLSKRATIYALPQASALIYDDGDLASIGDLYVFTHGEKHLFNK